MSYIDNAVLVTVLMFVVMGWLTGFNTQQVTHRLSTMLSLVISLITTIVGLWLTVPALTYSKATAASGVSSQPQLLKTYLLSGLIGIILYFVLHRVVDLILCLISKSIQSFSKPLGHGLLFRVCGAIWGLMSAEAYVIGFLIVGQVALSLYDKAMLDQIMLNSHFASFVALNFTDKILTHPSIGSLTQLFLNR